MLKYLVLLGVGVQFWGIYSYIRETLRGNTKPNRLTWFLWSAAPMIATAAALSDGVRLAVLPVFMSGFGPFLVFLSSFVNKESYWKLGAFDYFNGFLSLLALALWLVTKDPDVAIIVAIASDGFAAVPTLVKLWHFPETELVSPFAAGLFSALTSFAAIDTWHFSSYAFAMYLSLLNISLMSAYFRRRMFS